jgi:GNAT superfamily N-acetyltransferase
VVDGICTFSTWCHEVEALTPRIFASTCPGTLQVFAVLPEFQNKGIGVSLMKALESKVNIHSLICLDYRLIIAQVLPQGIATCLEAATEKNVCPCQFLQN